MVGVRAVVFAILLSACSAFMFSRSETWNDLKVTWGANPFNSNYFDELPRTTSDAIDEGFTQISECDENANWRGKRYIKNNDRAVTLLFDVNGFIAGIQSAVPANLSSGYPRNGLTPPFVRDGDFFVISAYFVDPSIICTTGRSQSDFDRDGTGTNLYIQNGTTAETDSLAMPMNEDQLANTQWVEGYCFYTMGVHYWHNLRADSECRKVFPVFLLYNGGRLNAFGWIFIADLPSPRFEHPRLEAIGRFVRSVPTCLSSAGRLSSMHIYMTHRVLLNTC